MYDAVCEPTHLVFVSTQLAKPFLSFRALLIYVGITNETLADLLLQ